ncbi:hypothetical protein SVI_4075 [Shewanella violacea DSS12]|uniref:Uncharacterized protein n=1 Tax=Shewanella violacea (strain JCM 10179 / CIP 106290 / LMG 19151 / DSS12) TaxID=637905 RepID=D4ZDY5_SHEVD|nr:hypothetical protein SVI_4075 [Shewanella violacea DSS12]
MAELTLYRLNNLLLKVSASLNKAIKLISLIQFVQKTLNLLGLNCH